MTDKPFSKYSKGLTGPASTAVKVTDTVVFDQCRSLWVGTAGTGTIVSADGDTLTDFPLKEGLNPIGATKVTFGTASDVWALY